MKKLLIFFLFFYSNLFAVSVITKTAAYTTEPNDQTIKADASGGGFTITLCVCSSSRTNLTQFFQKIDGTANTVVIDGNGSDTVNGTASFTLTSSRNSLRVRCDGANDWLIETGSSSSIVFTTGGITLSALAPGSDDEMLISNGTIFEAKAIPGCNATTEKPIYDPATNTWSCETDQTGGSSTLDIGTSVITSGSGSTNVLYDNSGVLGEQALSGLEDSDLAALAANSTNGLWTTTGSGTGAARSIAGTSNEICVADGDGIAGDPTLSICATIDLSAKALLGASPLVFEGATADANETTIAIADPTADNTVTIPDADSTTIQPQTCSGDDKVSGVSPSGVVTCSSDIGSSSAAPDLMAFFADSTFFYCAPSQLGGLSTTYICPGTAATLTSTGSLTASGRPPGITHSTSASANNVVGWTSNTSAVQVGCPFNNDVVFVVKPGGTITSMRLGVGLSVNSTLGNIGIVSTSAGTTTERFVSVVYDSGGSSDAANWHLLYTNGSSTKVDSDTGIPVAGSTIYSIRFKQQLDARSTDVTINGVSAGTISDESFGCAAGNVYNYVTTLTAAARDALFWGVAYRQRHRN